MQNAPHNLLLPDIPRAALPEVRNHTRYPSQYFQMLDARDALFHVMVSRTTYDLRPADTAQTVAASAPDSQQLLDAQEADAQTPLCEADEYLAFYEPASEGAAAERHAPAQALPSTDAEGLSLRSVYQESDFAPFKPRCDLLIVNARAWSPTVGTVATVTGRWSEADRRPSACWPAGAQLRRADGQLLWRKVINVTGPRSLTAGVLGWKLSEPEPATSVPIRWELAFGGTNQWWPTWPLQPWTPPDDKTDVPLDFHCTTNPAGTGWATAPWRNAVMDRVRRLRAPQLEALDKPFGAHHANAATRAAGRQPGKAGDAYSAIGLGPVGRWWLPRRASAGTYDAAWRESRWPRLPVDFDFGYWNCAPADQQIDHPVGGEWMTLVNLTPAGQTALRLPAPDLHLRVRLRAGPVFVLPMRIDTVLLDLAAMTLTLVHRRCVAAGPDSEVRVLELGTGTGGDRPADAHEARDPAACRRP
ncbi:DUF2169 domain-containing protein [Sphingomonas sp. NCPPB 2930]